MDLRIGHSLFTYKKFRAEFMVLKKTHRKKHVITMDLMGAT